MTGRRLGPEERVLWGRVMATVKPLHPVKPVATPPVVPKTSAPPTPPKAMGLVSKNMPKPTPNTRPVMVVETVKPAIDNNLDSHWDRRFHKGAVSPDISVDLHGQGLATAYARLDHTLEQAIHQRMRVILLVTGNARAHDRASGQGRGAIASVVRDWLAASRHASSISAVRGAHPRHGGTGALYIVLKR